ncbi:MAG TPA: class I SAM-dependent RNA methyltransferase [Myxococcales bacterium]|nr:class I SAM-dependent RNA methyltransferase [Myxococcales bacterium]
MPNLIDCPHRPPCPGCPRFGESKLPEEIWSELCAIAIDAELPEPRLHSASGLGHRHRARLAVRGNARNPKIGLFQSGSHRIVHTPHCPVHHPVINHAAREIREAIRETGIEPYADRPHRGALRYLQLVVERATERVQIVLVGRAETPDVLGDLPEAVERRLGDQLHGLFFNAQPERSNSILGPKMLRLAGEAATVESISGVDVFFPPGAFGQNHLPLFERAVERISELVPDDAVMAEFYCGVGSIGLPLLGRSKSIRFNERSPDGLAGLELGLAAIPHDIRERASVLPGVAGEALDALKGADVVLVDPPRRGLDAALSSALSEHAPQRLIYLACGLDRLIVDLEILTRPGQLVLRGLEAFDFFPFTEHVETLVWLDHVETGAR